MDSHWMRVNYRGLTLLASGPFFITNREGNEPIYFMFLVSAKPTSDLSEHVEDITTALNQIKGIVSIFISAGMIHVFFIEPKYRGLAGRVTRKIITTVEKLLVVFEQPNHSPFEKFIEGLDLDILDERDGTDVG
jgi:hypothetical protein